MFDTPMHPGLPLLEKRQRAPLFGLTKLLLHIERHRIGFFYRGLGPQIQIPFRICRNEYTRLHE